MFDAVVSGWMVDGGADIVGEEAGVTGGLIVRSVVDAVWKGLIVCGKVLKDSGEAVNGGNAKDVRTKINPPKLIKHKWIRLSYCHTCVNYQARISNENYMKSVKPKGKYGL